MIRTLIDALRAYYDALEWEHETRLAQRTYSGREEWDDPEYVKLFEAHNEAVRDTLRAENECDALGIARDEEFIILWMK